MGDLKRQTCQMGQHGDVGAVTHAGERFKARHAAMIQVTQRNVVSCTSQASYQALDRRSLLLLFAWRLAGEMPSRGCHLAASARLWQRTRPSARESTPARPGAAARFCDTPTCSLFVVALWGIFLWGLKLKK